MATMTFGSTTHLAELVRIRRARQIDLNEAILEGRSDALSRSEYQLGVQHSIKEMTK